MLRTDTLKIAERIIAAIYFITDFFDDKEPLKWKLRNLANNIVSYEIKDKSVIIREISSLFNIAKSIGLVSDINHSILMKELISLEQNAGKSLDTALIPATQSIPAFKENIKDKLVSAKKNGRRDIILSAIRRKKEVIIKDISPFLSGVSGKTIQRELLAMVKDGILKKSGEKRWSRYSLA